jgi:Sulfotransferase family
VVDVKPVTVVYIGGIGRSGSTLLDRMLGQLPGFTSVGELVFLWERGVVRNERCGCGEPFGDCAFWTAVGERAFGGWRTADAHAAIDRQRIVDRNRYLPLLLAPQASTRFAARLRPHAETLGRLYRAIADESGADVIVESSKHVSTAALLRSVAGVDLRIVRLVRDPRGVAFSWAKDVERPDSTSGTSMMARIGPGTASLRWLSYNAFMEVASAGRPSALVRYESVVRRPDETLERLASLAGRPISGKLSFIDSGRVDLGRDHTVAGNPLRFRTGAVDLRVDDAWTTQMSTRDRRLVTALTWPAMAGYGYRAATRSVAGSVSSTVS